MFPTVAFPRLPEWLPVEPENRPVELRPYGSEMTDLAVNFAGVERPWLMTSVLSRCAHTAGGRPAPEEAIWELPVSTRIEAVVALACAVSPRPLEWRVRCRYADCGLEAELELTAEEIQAVTAEACVEKLAPVSIGARTVWLRRPTGNDQRQWLASGAGPAAMAASLVVEPRLDDLAPEGISLEEIGASLDRAMEQYDPLIGFHLDVNCPDCGRATAQAPDLAGGALERLWSSQLALIDQVHRLASHYHWTEEEIARVPAWRRQAYLARLEGGEL